jgi:ribonuclease-3
MCQRLGYDFTDQGLLVRGLTHSSASDRRQVPKSNERLEFLGDRVLGLVVADMLLQTYGNSDEGELALRFNALVRKETCAEVAVELDLGAALIMSAGEAQSGGRENNSILGDACEAVIAAIYLDGGFDAARDFVERFWRTRLINLKKPPRDAKSALQEWAQGLKLPTPRYVVIERSGPDHAPSFIISVEVDDRPPVSGQGSAKRNAEQAAAEAFLLREEIWKEDD